MTTIQLGRNSLLSLYGELKIEVSAKTLYCKKHSEMPSVEKLRDKCTNVRHNGDGIRFVCPHLLSLSDNAKPLFEMLKEGKTIIFEDIIITPQFKKREEIPKIPEEKQGVFEKQENSINSIKKAFYELQKEREE